MLHSRRCNPLVYPASRSRTSPRGVARIGANVVNESTMKVHEPFQYLRIVKTDDPPPLHGRGKCKGRWDGYTTC